MSKFREDFWRSFHEARTASAHKHRGFRFWLNIITIILIIIVLWAARHELVDAWHLLGGVNIWILLTIVPVQFASYYSSAEIFLTYLRSRNQLNDMTPVKASAISLEYNFVNHVFPSAGVSGASYMVWRLGKMGVSAGQAAMSQLINYVILGGTFMTMMVIALIWAVIEDRAASWIVMSTTIAVVALIAAVIFGGYLINSKERLLSFGRWLTKWINRLVNKITFGKRKKALDVKQVEEFFADFYTDYQALKENKGVLKWPIFWGFIANLTDVVLIAVAFWALGHAVNFPILLISFGASSVGSFLMTTPGGVGAYEAVMISVLVAGGMDASVASAGVLLARMILVLGTIACGFLVYHAALRKYGRPDFKSAEDLGVEMDKAREHGYE
ncbi:MAG: YbhN family protein [Candidatus Saccharibacteria bacterium]|nr:YbhN family protein [Candidatus Saccharibacteria bacterium]